LTTKNHKKNEVFVNVPKAVFSSTGQRSELPLGGAGLGGRLHNMSAIG